MVTAHFYLAADELETRDVEREWLDRAWEGRENVLLSNGNPYRIVKVEYEGLAARVTVEAPQFTRGS
jgi:hypothetical protein